MSDMDRLILQHVAHSAGEDTDSRDGWCRWSTSDFWPWVWDDYKPLHERGLLERRETWKDILLKLTPAGWEALGAGETQRHENLHDPGGYRDIDGRWHDA